jgi:hypothetical protein
LQAPAEVVHAQPDSRGAYCCAIFSGYKASRSSDFFLNLHAMIIHKRLRNISKDVRQRSPA